MADQNPFLPLSTWNDARQAVLDGMARAPDAMAVHVLLDRVEQHRLRAIG